jgi:TonB family protein
MKMAGYSAVAHLVALIVFSMMPRFTTPPPMPRTAIAEIIPASALFPPAPPGGAPAAAQAEPTPSERAEAAREAGVKPEPAPEEPKKAAKKKPDPTVPPPPDEKPRQKPAPEPAPGAEGHERPAEPPAPSAADSMAGISLGGAVGSGAIPSIGSSAFPYDYYRSSLVAILQSNWRRPVAPEGLSEPVSCRVQFTILKSGIVQEARISAPSGNDALDQSALRAIYDSNPLPPLPFQYGQASVSAEVLFELTVD